MNDTLVTVSIVVGILAPFITAAFVFGIIKGTMNGISKTVDGVSKRVVSNEQLLIKHLDGHCIDCPGNDGTKFFNVNEIDSNLKKKRKRK